MSKIELTLAAFGLVFFGAALGSGATIAYQGHMTAATTDLQAAQYQLRVAVLDKAGHRVNALSLVNKALVEVNRGITTGAP